MRRGTTDQAQTLDGETSGPPFAPPAKIALSSFDAEHATQTPGGAIDLSHLEDGYVGVAATNENRLKFQVICGQKSYNYDLSGTGEPLIAPLNMGNGDYTFKIMQNTQGSSYIGLGELKAKVQLHNEFAPYLRPNVFCEYTPESAVVKKAYELASGAQNEGEVLRSIFFWVRDSIVYDYPKASRLANATGYIPNPDATLQSLDGICFDYASLTAAMLRSLGIPCQIITGYVSPDEIYHSWNMVYIDGKWVSLCLDAYPNVWTRVDLTFAAADDNKLKKISERYTYTDRYIY